MPRKVDVVHQQQYSDLFCRFQSKQAASTSGKELMNVSIRETHDAIEKLAPPRKRARKGSGKVDENGESWQRPFKQAWLPSY